mmetsp:Transcript_18800/g.41141  ORF Transcript_18800/g.41141 Transcript_18800/m.41141 type:complete len:308 (+) Transcript_18800:207-1130(+)
MATPTGILAVVRASRPSFRNKHDRLTFAIHAAILSEGFHLVGVGEAVDTKEEVVSGGTTEEVPLDGWNGSDDSYTFRYYNSETKAALLLKAVVMADKLLVSGLSGAEDVRFLELSVTKYTTDSSDYAAGYTNIPDLLTRLQSSVLKGTPPTSSTRNPAQRSTRLEEERERSRPASSLQEGPMRGYPPVQPAFGVGAVDAFGNLVPPSYGGNLIGPNHPGFMGGGGRHGGPPDPLAMIPPGARYDPIGPPGVPGFEPERFQPGHPMQGGRWGPGNHPDLPQMPGMPGQGRRPGNHPDLPPHRNDDMFM